MRVFFLLLFLLAALGGGSHYVFRIYLPRHPEVMDQVQERGIELAARIGLDSVGDSFDQRLGLCRVFAAPPASDRGSMILTEMKMDNTAPLPFSRPLRTEGQWILCLWPGREKTVLFSTDAQTEMTVHREQGEPPLVSLQAGRLVISSEKISAALLLGSSRLNLASGAPARVNAQVINGVLRLTALQGITEVELAAFSASSSAWMPTVLSVTGEGTFQLNGKPMEKNEEASLLPSGFAVKQVAPAVKEGAPPPPPPAATGGPAPSS